MRLLLLSLATFVAACVIRRTADADAACTLTSRVRSLPASLRTRRLAVSFLWLPQRPAPPSLKLNCGGVFLLYGPMLGCLIRIVHRGQCRSSQRTGTRRFQRIPPHLNRYIAELPLYLAAVLFRLEPAIVELWACSSNYTQHRRPFCPLSAEHPGTCQDASRPPCAS